MFRWFKVDWELRKLTAMAQLVQAVRTVDPGWKQIQIDRKDGGVVFSIVTDKAAIVHHLHETA